MRYRAPVLTATMFAATLSLSACGGGDTKATATTATTVSSSSSTTSAPSTSTSTSAATAHAAPSAPASPASSAATVTKTVQTASTTKSVAPKTTAAAAPAVQMGGNCGRTASGYYTMHADSNVACDYALRIGAQLSGNPPSHVTAYSSKLQGNLTSSCFGTVTGNIVCTTPAGSMITASVRG